MTINTVIWAEFPDDNPNPWEVRQARGLTAVVVNRDTPMFADEVARWELEYPGLKDVHPTALTPCWHPEHTDDPDVITNAMRKEYSKIIQTKVGWLIENEELDDSPSPHEYLDPDVMELIIRPHNGLNLYGHLGSLSRKLGHVMREAFEETL